MLYSVASALSVLLLASSAEAKAADKHLRHHHDRNAADVKPAHKNSAEANEHFKKFMRPSAFLNLEKTPFSMEEHGHLLNVEEAEQDGRSLKMRDNYISYTVFRDSACSMGALLSMGFLVNYCFSVDGDSSFTFKASTRAGTLVELDYTNGDCHGTPKHLTDITHQTGAMGFGNCADGRMLKYYGVPPMPQGQGVWSTFNDDYDMCWNGYFTGFSWQAANACLDRTVIDVSTCNTGGYVTAYRYEDDNCMMSSHTEQWWPMTCMYTMDGDSRDFIDQYIDNSYNSHNCIVGMP